MEFSLSYPASLEAARQAQCAEALGFSSIGFYDSPALEADVWIAIASAMQATSWIKVGTEILVPSLRHPMVQAAAIATVEQIAPGRLFVGVGTGFTGRKAMGQPALTWASIRDFLTQTRGLLAGEEVVIDGAVTRMMHSPGFAPRRPIQVPFLIAANGPKGISIAREHADGLIFGGPPDVAPKGFATLQLGASGLLLDDGETPESPRILEKARVLLALQYHLAYDGFHNMDVPIDSLPYGAQWRDMIEAFPERTRHLHLHDHHMTGTSPHDGAFLDRHPDAVTGFAREAAITSRDLLERVEALEALGATRVSCGGPSVGWEQDMQVFARALRL